MDKYSASHKLQKLAEALNQVESECRSTQAHFSNTEVKFENARTALNTAQANFETAKRQFGEAEGKREALLKQIADLATVESAPSPETSPATVDASTLPILSSSIDELEFTTRTKNVLRFEKIYHVGDLIQLTEHELDRTPGIGHRTFNEIKEVIALCGLNFGVKLTNWPPPGLERPQ